MRGKKFPIVLVAALFVLFATSLMAPSASAANKLKVLHAFTGGTDGGALYGGLIFDQAGNLYSTTLDGGTKTYGYGTAFSLTPAPHGTWTETVLHDFQVNPDYTDTDGLSPQAGLISDNAENLYGTTYYGGAPYDAGTVFELTPDGNGQFTETIIHAFDGRHGGYPQASLIFDSAGNLYGTTGGVESHCGTVFKLSPEPDGQRTETVLHDFGKPLLKPNGGCGLAGSLVFDSAGNLYGTTWNGGANVNFGCVFKLTPQPNGEWTETVLHSFNNLDGANPESSLIFDSVGNLYGAAAWGGNPSCNGGCGVIFELVPGENGQWTERVLHYFDGLDG